MTTPLRYFPLLMMLAAPLIDVPARAAAPQVRTQAPGYYRLMLGQFEVTALSDGTHPFPVDTVMANITAGQVRQDLADAELAPPVQGSINAYLVNTGKRLILVDAGAGALYGDCCGRLLANLRAAGYRPEQVDEILLTHLHKDHAGGVLAQGAAAFPNATLRLSQAEADYWLTPANKTAAPDFLASFFDSAIAAVAPYIAAGRFKPYAQFGVLEAGVQALAAPGHTPGQATYLIDGGGQQLLIWGDIVHMAPVQFPHPEATVKYDSADSVAQATRRTVMQMAAARHLLVGAAHIAFPGLGHVRARGAGYEWLPLNYDADPAKQ